MGCLFQDQETKETVLSAFGSALSVSPQQAALLTHSGSCGGLVVEPKLATKGETWTCIFAGSQQPSEPAWAWTLQAPQSLGVTAAQLAP